MSFFVKKNIAKNIYTQNIDDLEIKAKIPNDKSFFHMVIFIPGIVPHVIRNRKR